MVEDDADEDRMMLVKGEIGDQIYGGGRTADTLRTEGYRKQEASSDLCIYGGIALEF